LCSSRIHFVGVGVATTTTTTAQFLCWQKEIASHLCHNFILKAQNAFNVLFDPFQHNIAIDFGNIDTFLETAGELCRF